MIALNDLQVARESLMLQEAKEVFFNPTDPSLNKDIKLIQLHKIYIITDNTCQFNS